MNWTLRELLASTALCGVIAWSASQVGFVNPLFWAVLGLAILECAVFVALARTDSKRRFAMFVAIPIPVCCGLQLVFSVALMVHMGILFVLGAVCAVRPPLRVRTLSYLMGVSLAITLVVGVVVGWKSVQGLEDLRKRYPVISLEPRLQYEADGRRFSARNQTEMDAKVDQELKILEGYLEHSRGGLRIMSLQRLHSQQHEHFVRAIGFGVGRMLAPNERWLAMPPLTDLPFSPSALEESEIAGNRWSAWSLPSTPSDLESLHRVSRLDFLDGQGFGFVRVPRQEVIGFVEHAFHHAPRIELERGETVELERLELVSLLKFTEPRVYVVDQLPRMDQLSAEEISTRPLDEFENVALQRLWAGEEVVIDVQGDDIRMLGALRAGTQCLECHTVERGEMLGAFSYQLHRFEIARENPPTMPASNSSQ